MVSQHALQVSRPTPRGKVEGSGRGGGSPCPHQGGRLRCVCVCVPACTEAPPRQQMATAAGGTHPTGMHSCSLYNLLSRFDHEFQNGILFARIHT